jgi:hypothetical protein
MPKYLGFLPAPSIPKPSLPSININLPQIPDIPKIPPIPDKIPPIPDKIPPNLQPTPSPAPAPAPGQGPGQGQTQQTSSNPGDRYLDILKTLQEKLPSILDDFKKYYVFFNKNPEYEDYRRVFENIKSNLSQIENELFKLSNSVDLNIVDITNQLSNYNKLIEIEKKRNQDLNNKVSQFKNKYSGSKQLIDNYKEIYNLNYLKNIFMIVGIIISIFLLIKIFSKKNNITNSNLTANLSANISK